MQLYFLRHGEAEAASPALSDEERQLTENGRQDIRAVARALHRAGARPEVILTSPLRRARQSAEILQEVFGVPVYADARVLCTGCSLGAIEDLLAGRAEQRIVLVGHVPYCTQIVSQLIGGGNVRMSTAALARVDTDRVEPGAGLLVWLLQPALFPGSDP
jgi:phosphohistidine phosphatase